MRTHCHIAIDFDGVICDSANEASLAAWETSRKIWPNIFSESPSSDFYETYRLWRPVIHDCYELILLAYFVNESLRNKELINCIPSNEDFHKFRENLENENKVPFSREDALLIIGETRDELIARSTKEWQKSNPFFPGITTALAEGQANNNHTLHIVTKKPRRFVKLLLSYNGLSWSDNLLYAGEDGDKKEYLKMLLNNSSHSVIFIEDRLETLLGVEGSNELDSVKLLLAEWGYITNSDRQKLQNSNRISLLSLDSAIQLFSTGALS
jgi:phosphoglycolate phosphatase-like HAD superfamily hydrolase